MNARFYAVILCLVSIFAIPTTLQAQEEAKNDEQVEFDLLMQEASKYREEKRYDDVVSTLLKAYSKFPAPELLFNLAMAYKESGDCKNAISYYIETMDYSHKEGSSEIEKLVEKKILEFQCQSGETGQIQALLENSLEQHESMVIRVYLARLLIQKGECDVARKHLLKVIEIAEEGNTVSLAAIEDLKNFDCSAPAKDVIVEDPEKESSFNTVDYVSFASMGTGGLLLVAGLISDISTLDKIDEYRSVADSPNVSLQKRLDLKDEAETGQTTSIILYATGGILTAGGIALFLVNQMESETMPATARSSPLTLTPIISGRLLGANLRIGF